MGNRKDLLDMLVKDLGNSLKSINKKVFLTFCIMDVMYSILYLTGKSNIELPVVGYFLFYVVRSFVYGAIVLYLDSKNVFARNEIVRGSGSLIVVELLFGIRMYIHSELTAIYMMLCIPMFISIVYGNRKLIMRLYWLGVGILTSICLLVSVNPLANKPNNFYPSLIVIFVVFTCCLYCSKILVDYEESKEVIIDRYRDEMEAAINESCIDGLTRLYNFKTLSEVAEDWVKTKNGVAFCLIDIDNFKKVNDTHGHEFGNVVLKRLGLLLSYRSKENVFVARYGGEEFAILTYGMNPNSVLSMVEKLRRTFRLEEYRETKETYTFSGGMAFYKQGMTVTELFESADKKLYQAKHNGKNQVSF